MHTYCLIFKNFVDRYAVYNIYTPIYTKFHKDQRFPRIFHSKLAAWEDLRLPTCDRRFSELTTLKTFI